MTMVRVTYHHERDSWWAESPDVPGYTAVADTLEDLRSSVRDGLPFHLDVEAVEIVETLPAVLTVRSSYGTLTVVNGTGTGAAVNGAYGARLTNSGTVAPPIPA